MKKFYILIFICTAIFPAANIIQAQVNTQDSIALVNLYNSTHGPSWKRKDNWLSTFAPLGAWYGVTVTNNRVTGLSLNNNLLEGILPPALGNLTAIDSLSLSGNVLSGSISSSSYGNLANIIFFNLSSNQLNDTIPASLGDLSNLQHLDLSNNQFTGTIPASFSNLPNLQVLNLSFNGFKGNIPFFSTNLEKLDLSYNQLSGDFPSSLSNLYNLTDLILGSNNLTGSIPAGVGDLTALQIADLSNNLLSGNIPSSLGNLSGLQKLLLDENQLSGNIPSSLSNLINLSLLNVSYNQLSGDIPSLFGNLTNLQEMNSSYNQLSGNIPVSLGNLSNLNALFLNNNGFNGTVPSSLTGLSNLTSLDLGNNQFVFSGIEDIAQTFSFAIYAPQANITLHKNGNTLSVSAGGTLSNDSFHWYRNGSLDTTITGDSIFTVTDIGQYSVAVTNSAATQLTLYSNTVDITVLPVRLISFNGSLINGNGVLNWRTAQEMNSSHFNILRSVDAVNFSKIGELKSIGYSNNIVSYNYTDASVIKLNTPKVFYRLEEVDNDGRAQLSNVVSLDIPRQRIAIYPNPASNFIYLDLPLEYLHNASVVVFNMNGKIALQQNVANNSHQQINITKLSQGIYKLVILQDGKKLMVQSFVAER